MRRSEFATGADELILILRFNQARLGRKGGVGAQRGADATFSNWFGCTLMAVDGAVCTIEIANGDRLNVPTNTVRIPLAS